MNFYIILPIIIPFILSKLILLILNTNTVHNTHIIMLHSKLVILFVKCLFLYIIQFTREARVKI